MGPIVIYSIIGLSCLAGLVRPFWGLVGYLFLLFLQPEWNWRWDGLYGVQYQKPIIICVLIGSLIEKRPGRIWERWSIWSLLCLLVYCGFVLLSSLATDYPLQGARYIDVIWKTVVVSALLIICINDSRKSLIATWAACLASGYNAFRINEDYFLTGVTRYINDDWGYKGDSNVYSLYTLPFLVSSISLFFTSSSTVARVIAGSLAILHIHQMMLLESRGGMLGVAVAAAAILFFVNKTVYVNIAICIMISGSLVLAGPPVMKELESIFAKEEERDYSAASRLSLWSIAFNIALDHPILGIGPNATQYMIPKQLVEYSDLESKHPHNVFLEIASGSGIPAAIAFLGFVFLPVVHALRTLRNREGNFIASQSIRLSLIGTILGFCVAGMFAGSGLIESIYLMTAIWIGGMIDQFNTVDNSPQIDHDKEDCTESGRDIISFTFKEIANSTSVRALPSSCESEGSD